MPGDSRIICLYREDKLIFAESGVELRKGDKIVVLARIKDVDALKERWSKEAKPAT
jgi:Trk K+ transport system NAD-binding subunit